MSSFRPFQEQLLAVINQSFAPAVPEELRRVYMDTPRHHFIRRYRLANSQVWHDITADTLDRHLPTLYQNSPVILDGDTDTQVASTVSQPSLVLHMLDMMQLQPGHRVLEIGTASGWNAAMMGRLVGPEGHVHTVEILPALAAGAREAIASLGIDNVHVVAGDGGFGYAPGAPYDRVMFTVGAYDLPRALYDQVADGGLLLMVLKHRGGGDTLHLFKKTDGYFTSIESLPCGFVSMTGEYRMPEMDPIRLDDLPYWQAIRETVVSQRPFWWGGSKGSGAQFAWKTMGFRAFLGIIAPERLGVFERNGGNDIIFGLYDHTAQSVTLAHDDLLTTYGTPHTAELFRAVLLHWTELGMPGAANFDLKAYPIDREIQPLPGQWLTRRRDTQYLWELRQQA